MSSLLSALKRHQDRRSEDTDKGFTLIELLVVVIIIGILAAIAIPVYLGVQNNAKDSAVQSDLTNLKTAVVSLQVSGSGPTAKTSITAASQVDTATASAGATFGGSTSNLTFYPSSTGFCVLGISKTGKSFVATDQLGVAKGSCMTTGVASAANVTTAP